MHERVREDGGSRLFGWRASKVKLLMALAFDAANGAANGVMALAQQAMAAAATKQEIAETVRVAAMLVGEGTPYTASQARKGIVE